MSDNSKQNRAQNSWYDHELEHIDPETEDVFLNYSHIPRDQIKSHITDIVRLFFAPTPPPFSTPSNNDF